MAIPPEFSFENEAEFTTQLLVPLLHRLGFAVVVHYHGSRELGKDLVFGQIDNFGHVRYYGLQAKFLKTLTLKHVDSLVSDCRQAFANPFNHPHTGMLERVSVFYAVNGGSISDQAREHFFNSLEPHYVANARLIDGKGLLELDRWAAANRSQMLLPHLNGLILEMEYNSNLICALIPAFYSYVKANSVGTKTKKPNPIPPDGRLRLYATAAYLERPFLTESIDTRMVENYWRLASSCNKLMDKATTSITTVVSVEGAVIKMLNNFSQIGPMTGTMVSQMRGLLQSLGPLTSL